MKYTRLEFYVNLNLYNNIFHLNLIIKKILICQQMNMFYPKKINISNR